MTDLFIKFFEFLKINQNVFHLKQQINVKLDTFKFLNMSEFLQLQKIGKICHEIDEVNVFWAQSNYFAS